MSQGKYVYVRSFEEEAKCLPNSWIVVRINGKSFERFAKLHGFNKPNDKRALELMTKAASSVMGELKDVTVAYGAADEYSFVFRKDTELYNRRHDKILSIVNSLFSTSFIFYWSSFFPYTKMLYPPSFDARIILYPTDQNLRDYLCWRQTDAHLKNINNTTLWGLVQKKKYLFQQAEDRVKRVSVSRKTEILSKELKIDYSLEPPLFRKGTTLVRKLVPSPEGPLKEFIFPHTVDIREEQFWKENPEIIEMKSLQIFNKKEGDFGYPVQNNVPVSNKQVLQPLSLSNLNAMRVPPPQMPPPNVRPMEIGKENVGNLQNIEQHMLDRGALVARNYLSVSNLNAMRVPPPQMPPPNVRPMEIGKENVGNLQNIEQHMLDRGALVARNYVPLSNLNAMQVPPPHARPNDTPMEIRKENIGNLQNIEQHMLDRGALDARNYASLSNLNAMQVPPPHAPLNDCPMEIGKENIGNLQNIEQHMLDRGVLDARNYLVQVLDPGMQMSVQDVLMANYSDAFNSMFEQRDIYRGNPYFCDCCYTVL